MSNPMTILLVEDDPDDEALIVRALRTDTSANVEVARNCQLALDYLDNDVNDTPGLVLSDLRLPNIDGLKVLRRIREGERTCLTPIVILMGANASTDVPANASTDVPASYRHGANSYVRKPLDIDQFAERIHQISVYWLVVNEPPPPPASSKRKGPPKSAQCSGWCHQGQSSVH